jgi:hypothetical protein
MPHGPGPGSIEAKASGIWSFLRTAFTETRRHRQAAQADRRDFAMLGSKVKYVRTYRAVDGGESCRRSPPERAEAGAGAADLQRQRAKQQFGRGRARSMARRLAR